MDSEKLCQACEEFNELFRHGSPVRTLQQLRATCKGTRDSVPNGIQNRGWLGYMYGVRGMGARSPMYTVSDSLGIGC